MAFDLSNTDDLQDDIAAQAFAGPPPSLPCQRWMFRKRPN
jgi:hypothetical protein